MQQPSRRALLRYGVVAAAAVAALPAAGTAHAGVLLADPGRATRLRRSVFAGHAGSAFLLSDGVREYHAVLVAVEDLSPRYAGDDRRFGLLFRVRGGGLPPAGTYTMGHAALRPFALYVGPVTADDHVYQAVVNA